jgi:hypothetical protein
MQIVQVPAINPSVQAMRNKVTDTERSEVQLLTTPYVHFSVAQPPHKIALTPHREKTTIPDLVKLTLKSTTVLFRQMI